MSPSSFAAFLAPWLLALKYGVAEVLRQEVDLVPSLRSCSAGVADACREPAVRATTRRRCRAAASNRVLRICLQPPCRVFDLRLTGTPVRPVPPPSERPTLSSTANRARAAARATFPARIAPTSSPPMTMSWVAPLRLSSCMPLRSSATRIRASSTPEDRARAAEDVHAAEHDCGDDVDQLRAAGRIGLHRAEEAEVDDGRDSRP